MKFTPENTDGYSKADLDILNVAYNDAWGAIKGCHQRLDLRIGESFAQEIAERTQALFDDGEHDGEKLAEAVLTRYGYKPRRDSFSLECDVAQ